MSTYELSQIIVENGITTQMDLPQFADELCGEEKTDIAEFVVNRGSLQPWSKHHGTVMKIKRENAPR